MSKVFDRGQHEAALSAFEANTCVRQSAEDFVERFDVGFDGGTRDEDVVKVDADMREPLEEAVHGPLKNGWG